MAEFPSIDDVVYQAVRAVRNSHHEELHLDTALFGQPKALLDSFSLVQLIFELERGVRQATQREVKFTMQQLLTEKDNPFHSVRSLVAFLSKTLNEATYE